MNFNIKEVGTQITVQQFREVEVEVEVNAVDARVAKLRRNLFIDGPTREQHLINTDIFLARLEQREINQQFLERYEIVGVIHTSKVNQ